MVTIVDKARCKWTARCAVEVIIESERFIVVCSRCPENFKFENFTLSFGRLRQRILLKYVPHVQHDYFSSFNQSDHCFLASSLPLPSSLLKLAINTQRRWSILNVGEWVRMIMLPKVVIHPGSCGCGPWALLASRLLETIGLNEFFFL